MSLPNSLRGRTGNPPKTLALLGIAPGRQESGARPEPIGERRELGFGVSSSAQTGCRRNVELDVPDRRVGSS